MFWQRESRWNMRKSRQRELQWEGPSREPIEAGVLFGAVYRGELVTDGFENMDCGAVQAVERGGSTDPLTPAPPSPPNPRLIFDDDIDIIGPPNKDMAIIITKRFDVLGTRSTFNPLTCFTGPQEFYRDFIILAATTSTAFIQHLLDNMIDELLSLNRTVFTASDLEESGHKSMAARYNAAVCNLQSAN
uniref:Uncharacterized protein n=1 Tax=Timema bartmani TaxID=61472 RepID=A0A7R9F6V5_9NEOP|nr:unnamed protein product [Timema bartmani]